MAHKMYLLLALGLICLCAILLLTKIFWPRRAREPDETDNWAQRNDLRTPSLEKPQEAQDYSVEAAVASEMMGPD